MSWLDRFERAKDRLYFWAEGATVKNKIEWVNEDEKYFQPGKIGDTFPGPLFFLYNSLPIKGLIKVVRNHNRAFQFLRIINPEKQEFYTAKGGGAHQNGTIRQIVPMESGEGGQHLGVFMSDAAKYDRDFSKDYERSGCDVAIPVAIIRLLEVPILDGLYQQDPRLEKSAKIVLVNPVRLLTESQIKEGVYPVSYVRKCITDWRIEDLYKLIFTGSLGQAPEPNLKLAKDMVDEVTTILYNKKITEKKLTPIEYLIWYTQRLGMNFGKAHNANLFQNFASRGNRTLACEFIDNDGGDRLADLESEVAKSGGKTNLAELMSSRVVKDLSWDSGDRDPLGALRQLESLIDVIGVIWTDELLRYFQVTKVSEVGWKLEDVFFEEYLRYCPQNLEILQDAYLYNESGVPQEV